MRSVSEIISTWTVYLFSNGLTSLTYNSTIDTGIIEVSIYGTIITGIITVLLLSVLLFIMLMVGVSGE